jgi:hypothetical protein
VVSFTPWSLYSRRKNPGARWKGGWVDLGADVDDMKKRKF